MNPAPPPRPFRILTDAGTEHLTLEEARSIVGVVRIDLPIVTIECQQCHRPHQIDTGNLPLAVEYDGARRLAYCIPCASELHMERPLREGLDQLGMEPTAAELLDLLKGHRIPVRRGSHQPGERSIGEILRERAAREQAEGPAAPTLRLSNFPSDPEGA